MAIRIIRAGVLTTVQDLGRPMFRGQAVPTSGAMDQLSARLANKAVGNPDGSALIEFNYGGASFSVECDLLIAYSGYGAIYTVNGVDLPCNRPLFIPAGTSITLKENLQGSRSYLAVAGGWKVTEIMGSRSTYLSGGFGGFEGRALEANDLLINEACMSPLSKSILEHLKSSEINFPKWSISDSRFVLKNEVRVVPAQEFLWFDAISIISLLTKSFVVNAQGNRMGIPIDGPLMSRRKTDELLSTAVTIGTIQVTGNGNLVLLMADAQTTGGYPRIAQVASVDLVACAQMRPNKEIFFKEISSDEAEELYLEREMHLKQLDATIAYKFMIE